MYSQKTNLLILLTGLLVFQTHLLAQPVITSFTPASGRAGITVTITGSNFNATPSGNIVRFGSIRAAVTGGTTSSLTVTVPSGAAFEPIAVTSNNLTAYSSYPFILTYPALSADLNASSFTRITQPAYGYTGSAMGDIDDDAKNDLTFASDNSLGILKNQSTASTILFAPVLSYATGNYTYGNALADFDGDGLLDIAVAKASSSSSEWIYGQLSVMRNTTSGGVVSFSPRIDLQANDAERSWYWIDVRDIDMDGKPDIVITNNTGPGRIAIFRNTSTPGTLSFSAAIKFTTGSSPRVVSLGDLDKDGRPDIVTGNQAGSISIFRNLSTPGNIVLGTRSDYATRLGLYPEDAQLVDIDGDGKTDILVADHFHPNPGTISVFRNTTNAPGPITVAARQEFVTPADPFSIACSDLNGDGKPDLLVTNFISQTISLYKNASTPGNVSLIEQVTFSGFVQPRDAIIGDLNGDAKPELIVHDALGTFEIFTNNTTLSTLPLTLFSFTGQKAGNKVQLKWVTAHEQHTAHFVVERAAGSSSFEMIGKVIASGNTTAERLYDIIDHFPAANTKNYYRLKMVDQDGRFTYSTIVDITMDDHNSILISPNPGTGIITIQHPAAKPGRINVIDAGGRVVKTVQTAEGSSVTLLPTEGLATGRYIIFYSNGSYHTSTSFMKAN